MIVEAFLAADRAVRRARMWLCGRFGHNWSYAPARTVRHCRRCPAWEVRRD